MKLRFTPRATQDLIDIAEYIRAENPLAALLVRDAILDSISLLTAFPVLGKLQKVEGVRKLITRKYRYAVYYSISLPTDEVLILAIRHPARPPFV